MYGLVQGRESTVAYTRQTLFSKPAEIGDQPVVVEPPGFVPPVNALMLGAASIITGIIIGGWLMAGAATAAMSHSQRPMQRKVGYWQERALRAEDPGGRARTSTRPDEADPRRTVSGDPV